MKRFFSNGRLSSWLTKRQIRWWIVSLGCFLGGIYLVGRHFGFLIFWLAIASMAIGSAVTAYLNWNRVKGTRALLWIKKAPPMTATWDYRPRDITRRDAAFESEKTQPAGIVGSNSSGRNENGNVWFNFMSPEPTAEHKPSIARSSGDAGKISTYDQSPIDNESVAAE